LFLSHDLQKGPHLIAIETLAHDHEVAPRDVLRKDRHERTSALISPL
jgi:hypothetical protein